jgi:regulator of replication initiation timing
MNFDLDNLKQWLDGKYVSPQDFKDSLTNIINEYERMKQEIDELEEDNYILRIESGMI